ncbi:CAF17-like 4Fe-4S cluster assembly/insertion protein YgfZ [Wolbachia endosymbiont of Dirofilaria (Dirofilaria) immitis]|uniref:CAF17-like 4Fe-4S cluster assembly/insertion protein YgfZ n=1 Tax=Wolbachia endosymbiont of Dirofilaria (Dirofilaria) immitis TaxID=1812115 RepID=UPI00158BE691|nr:folate-binding protein YgfZ [Wolbachia endosymbiont of Dirofilaria (Dirofilaria) immitis]QKX02261.1 folate-binding protein [Wolbachia endosymbiont of Dirofilaria (Dirofilaria) immitis]
MSYIPLQSRSAVILYGQDTRDFLQGIITNDINNLGRQKAIYSLLLNSQGKYLYDFFLVEYGKYILLECENIYLQPMIEKLNLLKTYLKVKIKDVSTLYKVGVLFNTQLTEHSNESQVIFQDPRHKSLGMRIIHKDEIKQPVENFIHYERVRIQNLIPDGVKDMVQNSSFPLQYLIDKVNGISFNKGCYIGQEVVNRMSRQEIFRRKLYSVKGNNVLPNIGTKIINENNEEVGELRSSVDKIGLALLNTAKSYASLYADEVKIFVC